jgi:hypothetical protein
MFIWTGGTRAQQLISVYVDWLYSTRAEQLIYVYLDWRYTCTTAALCLSGLVMMMMHLHNSFGMFIWTGNSVHVHNS